LRGIYGAIKDGEATWKTVMENKDEHEGRAKPDAKSTNLADVVSAKTETINQETGEITKAAPEPLQAGDPPAVSVATLIKRVNACKDADEAGNVMTDPDVDALNAEDASKLMAAYREKWGEA